MILISSNHKNKYLSDRLVELAILESIMKTEKNSFKKHDRRGNFEEKKRERENRLQKEHNK